MNERMREGESKGETVVGRGKERDKEIKKR